MTNRSGASHLVIDDFLGTDAADRLLDQILAGEALFKPSEVTGSAGSAHDTAIRSSLRLPGRVGVDLDPLKAAVHSRFAELRAGIGVGPFDIDHTECSIVANRDGDFYKRHIDTGARHRGHVRVISCVYYLHRRPRAFSGGELVIHSIVGTAGSVSIEPAHDRLAVFPSFLPHEVAVTRCAGGFADSRFSINCWLHRAVDPRPATEGTA